MIEYIKGDATSPVCDGVLVHVCNDVGAWGAGFVLSLSARYPETKDLYKSHDGSLYLGMCIPQRLSENLRVVHMIAQSGLKSKNNPHPLSMEHLKECLTKVSKRYPDSVIHMPKIGSGLGGGDWSVIEGVIESSMNNRVIVYVM